MTGPRIAVRQERCSGAFVIAAPRSGIARLISPEWKAEVIQTLVRSPLSGFRFPLDLSRSSAAFSAGASERISSPHEPDSAEQDRPESAGDLRGADGGGKRRRGRGPACP